MANSVRAAFHTGGPLLPSGCIRTSTGSDITTAATPEKELRGEAPHHSMACCRVVTRRLLSAVIEFGCWDGLCFGMPCIVQEEGDDLHKSGCNRQLPLLSPSPSA